MPPSKTVGNTPECRFVSLISHELRNPLAIIKSQAQLMEREASAHGDTSPGKDALCRSCIIRRAVDRLESLFEHWLEVERLDSGELQPRLSPLTILPWLDELVRTSSQEYQRPMRLLAPQEIARIQVQADRRLLTAAIHHLLDNAIKFSAASTPIQIQLSCSGDEVAIEVKDAGIGIAANDLEDIFQKFIRIAPESNVAGMGLGLYLTERVATLHAGRIEAVSTLGQGSSFTLWLPLSS